MVTRVAILLFIFGVLIHQVPACDVTTLGQLGTCEVAMTSAVEAGTSTKQVLCSALGAFKSCVKSIQGCDSSINDILQSFNGKLQMLNIQCGTAGIQVSIVTLVVAMCLSYFTR